MCVRELNACLPVHFVVHLWEGLVAPESVPHTVVQRVVEHLAVFLPCHVGVSVHHLETGQKLGLIILYS